MRIKNKEMQFKFEEYEAERIALRAENENMKSFKTDSEQLVLEKKAFLEATSKCESLTTQLEQLRL